jgi:hypothetical protein
MGLGEWICYSASDDYNDDHNDDNPSDDDDDDDDATYHHCSFDVNDGASFV